jgi:hypothetical protein
MSSLDLLDKKNISSIHLKNNLAEAVSMPDGPHLGSKKCVNVTLLGFKGVLDFKDKLKHDNRYEGLRIRIRRNDLEIKLNQEDTLVDVLKVKLVSEPSQEEIKPMTRDEEPPEELPPPATIEVEEEPAPPRKLDSSLVTKDPEPVDEITEDDIVLDLELDEENFDDITEDEIVEPALNLEDLSKDDLKEIARKLGVKVTKRDTIDKLIKKIREAQDS